MMHTYTLFIIAYAVVVVQADLSCLGWGLISPVVGIFCYFEPTYFKTAENNTVNTVKEMAQNAENLVKFDLTHNPAVVAYNFIDQTEKGGINQGNQYLGNITQDFEDVTIGFGKGVAQPIITILELTDWTDLSSCLIKGATGLALHSERMAKRMSAHGISSPRKGHGMSMAQPPTNNTVSTALPQTSDMVSVAQPQENEALAMARGCLSDRFKRLAQPAVFHTNSKSTRIIQQF